MDEEPKPELELEEVKDIGAKIRSMIDRYEQENSELREENDKLRRFIEENMIPRFETKLRWVV